MPTSSIRDSQRKKLYRAEWKAFFGTEKYGEAQTPHSLDFQTVPECQKYVDHVTASDTWKALDIWVEHIRVKDGRGRRKAGADSEGDTILLPKWSRVRWVILHELAHIANDYVYNFEPDPEGLPGDIIVNDVAAPHGAEYAGVYAYLVRGLLGEVAYRRLLQEFERYGVKVAPIEDQVDVTVTDTPAPPQPVTVTDTDPSPQPVTDTDTLGKYCLNCGMVLMGTRAKFCSDACRYAHHNYLRHERTEDDRHKVCVICSKEFVAKRADKKTCSPRCRQRLRRRS